MERPLNPLVGPPPVEVPLVSAPLVRVIAQVRFPMVASIERRDYIAPFQEAIRDQYPILRPEQDPLVVVGHPHGFHELRQSTAWRFYDPGSDWRVTLAPDFLALETGRYSSRHDFLQRLEVALSALEAHVDPKVMDRLGVRYIDRITGEEALSALPSLVRPEICGLFGGPLSDQVELAMSEHSFSLPDEGGQMTARWGQLPPQKTFDPATIEPIATRSWVLDVDAFVAAQGAAFSVTAAVAQATRLAERIYSFFRWVVTDAFLRRYGGQP